PGWADSALIIDPVLTYSTYLGGSGNTAAYAVAVDSAGSAYVAGETLPANFGATFHVSDSTTANDAFLVKMNSRNGGRICGLLRRFAAVLGARRRRRFRRQCLCHG